MSSPLELASGEDDRRLLPLELVHRPHPHARVVRPRDEARTCRQERPMPRERELVSRVEHVGLPEAQLNLAHATIYLATAPKSNAVVKALGAARRDVRELGAIRPPKSLRDTHYRGAKKLGHGEGYVYPPEDSAGYEVDHLPEELRGRRYYEPSAE